MREKFGGRVIQIFARIARILGSRGKSPRQECTQRSASVYSADVVDLSARGRSAIEKYGKNLKSSISYFALVLLCIFGAYSRSAGFGNCQCSFTVRPYKSNTASIL